MSASGTRTRFHRLPENNNLHLAWSKNQSTWLQFAMNWHIFCLTSGAQCRVSTTVYEVKGASDVLENRVCEGERLRYPKKNKSEMFKHLENVRLKKRIIIHRSCSEHEYSSTEGLHPNQPWAQTSPHVSCQFSESESEPVFFSDEVHVSFSPFSPIVNKRCLHHPSLSRSPSGFI